MSFDNNIGYGSINFSSDFQSYNSQLSPRQLPLAPPPSPDHSTISFSREVSAQEINTKKFEMLSSIDHYYSRIQQYFAAEREKVIQNVLAFTPPPSPNSISLESTIYLESTISLIESEESDMEDELARSFSSLDIDRVNMDLESGDVKMTTEDDQTFSFFQLLNNQ